MDNYQTIESLMANGRSHHRRSTKRAHSFRGSAVNAKKVNVSPNAIPENNDIPEITTTFLDDTYQQVLGRFNNLRERLSNVHIDSAQYAPEICYDELGLDENLTGHPQSCSCPKGTEKITSTKIGGTNCDYVQETVIERSMLVGNRIQTITRHIIKRCDKNGRIDVEVKESKHVGRETQAASYNNISEISEQPFVGSSSTPNKRFSNVSASARFDNTKSPRNQYLESENLEQIGAMDRMANSDKKLEHTKMTAFQNNSAQRKLHPERSTSGDEGKATQNISSTQMLENQSMPSLPSLPPSAVPSSNIRPDTSALHTPLSCCPCICQSCRKDISQKLSIPLSRLDPQTLNALVNQRDDEGRHKVDYYLVGEILEDTARREDPQPSQARQVSDISRSSTRTSYRGEDRSYIGEREISAYQSSPPEQRSRAEERRYSSDYPQPDSYRTDFPTKTQYRPDDKRYSTERRGERLEDVSSSFYQGPGSAGYRDEDRRLSAPSYQSSYPGESRQSYRAGDRSFSISKGADDSVPSYRSSLRGAPPRDAYRADDRHYPDERITGYNKYSTEPSIRSNYESEGERSLPTTYPPYRGSALSRTYRGSVQATETHPSSTARSSYRIIEGSYPDMQPSYGTADARMADISGPAYQNLPPTYQTGAPYSTSERSYPAYAPQEGVHQTSALQPPEADASAFAQQRQPFRPSYILPLPECVLPPHCYAYVDSTQPATYQSGMSPSTVEARQKPEDSPPHGTISRPSISAKPTDAAKTTETIIPNDFDRELVVEDGIDVPKRAEETDEKQTLKETGKTDKVLPSATEKSPLKPGEREEQTSGRLSQAGAIQKPIDGKRQPSLSAQKPTDDQGKKDFLKEESKEKEKYEDQPEIRDTTTPPQVESVTPRSDTEPQKTLGEVQQARTSQARQDFRKKSVDDTLGISDDKREQVSKEPDQPRRRSETIGEDKIAKDSRQSDVQQLISPEKQQDRVKDADQPRRRSDTIGKEKVSRQSDVQQVISPEKQLDRVKDADQQRRKSDDMQQRKLPDKQEGRMQETDQKHPTIDTTKDDFRRDGKVQDDRQHRVSGEIDQQRRKSDTIRVDRTRDGSRLGGVQQDILPGKQQGPIMEADKPRRVSDIAAIDSRLGEGKTQEERQQKTEQLRRKSDTIRDEQQGQAIETEQRRQLPDAKKDDFRSGEQEIQEDRQQRRIEPTDEQRRRPSEVGKQQRRIETADFQRQAPAVTRDDYEHLQRLSEPRQARAVEEDRQQRRSEETDQQRQAPAVIRDEHRQRLSDPRQQMRPVEEERQQRRSETTDQQRQPAAAMRDDYERRQRLSDSRPQMRPIEDARQQGRIEADQQRQPPPVTKDDYEYRQRLSDPRQQMRAVEEERQQRRSETIDQQRQPPAAMRDDYERRQRLSDSRQQGPIEATDQQRQPPPVMRDDYERRQRLSDSRPQMRPIEDTRQQGYVEATDQQRQPPVPMRDDYEHRQRPSAPRQQMRAVEEDRQQGRFDAADQQRQPPAAMEDDYEHRQRPSAPRQQMRAVEEDRHQGRFDAADQQRQPPAAMGDDYERRQRPSDPRQQMRPIEDTRQQGYVEATDQQRQTPAAMRDEYEHQQRLSDSRQQALAMEKSGYTTDDSRFEDSRRRKSDYRHDDYDADDSRLDFRQQRELDDSQQRQQHRKSDTTPKDYAYSEPLYSSQSMPDDMQQTRDFQQIQQRGSGQEPQFDYERSADAVRDEYPTPRSEDDLRYYEAQGIPSEGEILDDTEQVIIVDDKGYDGARGILKHDDGPKIQEPDSGRRDSRTAEAEKQEQESERRDSKEKRRRSKKRDSKVTPLQPVVVCYEQPTCSCPCPTTCDYQQPCYNIDPCYTIPQPVCQPAPMTCVQRQPSCTPNIIYLDPNCLLPKEEEERKRKSKRKSRRSDRDSI